MPFHTVIAVSVAAAALGSIGVGSHAIRRRYLSGWTGPPGVLASVITGLALTVTVVQVLGALGLFSRVPVVLGLLAVGAAAWWLAHTVPRREDAGAVHGRSRSGAGPERRGHPFTLASIAAVALAASSWGARTALGLQGPIEVESIRYRLPLSARFAQEHRITSLHWVDTHVASLVAYYPHLSELVHGFGIVLFATEVASPFLNPLFATLALLAAWCIGRPFGVAPLSMMGALVALSTPDMVHMHAGSATNDVLAVAMFLSALALWSSTSHLPTSDVRLPLALSAAAAGMSIGTKYTFLPAFLALTVVVVVSSPKGTRWTRAAIWTITATVLAAPWYLRNLFTVSNPVPAVDVELGPIELSAVPTSWATEPLAPHLLDLQTWQDHLLSSFRLAWGPAYWAIGILASVALVAVLLGGPTRLVRSYGGLALLVIVAYVTIPQPLGHAADPFQSLTFNLRYMAHGVALALVLLPTVPRLGSGGRAVVAGAYLAIIAFTQLDATYWDISPFATGIAPPVTGTMAVVGVVAGVVVLGVGLMFSCTDLLSRRVPWPAVWAVAGIVLLAGSVVVDDYYRDHRFIRLRESSEVVSWAHDVDGDIRLGLVGAPVEFALYGSTLSNHVQYLGDTTSDGAFVPITTCERWREVVNERDLTHVVTLPPLFSTAEPSQQAWTGSDPAASLVLGQENVSVFRINAELDPDACPDDTTR